MARELGLNTCEAMAQAFLDNRKTQTRRLIKPQPNWEERNGLKAAGWSWRTKKVQLNSCTAEFLSKEIGKESRYRVGDHLYAKETWAADRQYDSVPPRAIPVGINIWFPDHLGWKRDKHMGRVRTGRFMPKKFARIWREVTGVRVERVQDISIIDARAEGIAEYKDGDHEYANRTSIENFAMLWDRLHPKPGERWGDNPWVLALVLEPIEKHEH